MPRRRWLAHCAEHFTGIEVNATFYRALRPEALARWSEETPPGFSFALKGHRAATHLRRLEDVAEPVAVMRQGARPLGDKVAAVIWQLPPSLAKDTNLLEGFAGVLDGWRDVRHAIEFRHTTWFDDDTAAILARHAVANCISDSASRPRWDAVTTDLAYVRLHGRPRTYASAYGRRGLAPWARRVRTWGDEGRHVHVYFDNDADGAAPLDALGLMAMVGTVPPWRDEANP